MKHVQYSKCMKCKRPYRKDTGVVNNLGGLLALFEVEQRTYLLRTFTIRLNKKRKNVCIDCLKLFQAIGDVEIIKECTD